MISFIVTTYVMKCAMFFEITENITSKMRHETRSNFIVLILKYQNHATFYLTLPQLPVPGPVIANTSFLQEPNSLMTSTYSLTSLPLAPLPKRLTAWTSSAMILPLPSHDHTLQFLLSLLPSWPPQPSIFSIFIQAAEHAWRKIT